ncbi:uncharacterized protein EAF01_009152 [Botrytis porri]|uniref:uncharacterized protein n=1 Tax=Botrytis porri TaxID=87229 RepID=UPI00190052DB|nr:uncharacterized protein EAF01_009152 [Botrytis porri]KAF7896749.1 hypothetical protein EAF01_009152 [Botrytis porri]
MQFLPIQTRSVHFLVSSKRSSDSPEDHTCPVENINDPRKIPSIIRIMFMIPVVAAISFLCIHFEEATAYISPINELYEAFAFAAFFQLLYNYVLKETHAQSLSRQASQFPPICKTVIQIFQFPAIMCIVFLMEDPRGKGNIPTTIAILAHIRFYKSTKSLTAARKPLHKLMVFKRIVFLNFFQTTLFAFLSPRLPPTNILITRDLTDGIPNLLVSLEMVIFSILFLKFYAVGEYAKGCETYQGGIMGIKVITGAANSIAFIGEMVRMVMGRENMEKGGNSCTDSSYKVLSV